MSKPYLSIIIPAHNEEGRLPATLEQLFAYLCLQPYTAEVLVVDNASLDGTRQIAESYAINYPNLRVISQPTPGKGAAVRLGMLEARGDYRFMCDVDFSMPVDQINRFFPPELKNCDIAIASREASGAVRYNEPAYRHMVGRIFNWLIRTIALPGLQDTQCGFKCFTEQAVLDLFPRQTLNGWAFDVEVLFIARRRGYRIAELPIPWYFNPESKISVARDSLRMFLDLLRIRLNGLRGEYGKPA